MPIKSRLNHRRPFIDIVALTYIVFTLLTIASALKIVRQREFHYDRYQTAYLQ